MTQAPGATDQRIKDLYQKALQYADQDPETALSVARKTAEAICQAISTASGLAAEGGEEDRTLDKLIGALQTAKLIRAHEMIPLRTVQWYGNVGAHSRVESHVITARWAQPCLRALDVVYDWYLAAHAKHLPPPPPDQPAVEDAGEAAEVLSASALAERMSRQLGPEICNRVRAALGVKSRGAISNKLINLLLAELGLVMKKPEGGWGLTAEGAKWGKETQGIGPGGAPIQVLRWNEGVLDRLSPRAREKAGLTADAQPVPAGDLLSASELGAELVARIGAAGANALREHLGIKNMSGEISAQIVNQLLQDCGFHVKGADGWALTKEGAEWGAETSGRGPQGQAVPMLRWQRRLIDHLAENIEERVGPLPTDEEELDEEQADDVEEVEVDYDTVGDLTARRAIDLELVDYVALVTGRSTQSVKRALSEAHGRTKVRNVFREYYDMAVIGNMTIRWALDCDAVGAIARLIGFSERRVKARLQGVHGRTSIAKVFEDVWG